LLAPVGSEAVAHRPVVQTGVGIGAPAHQGDHVSDAWVHCGVGDNAARVVFEAVGVRVHCAKKQSRIEQKRSMSKFVMQARECFRASS